MFFRVSPTLMLVKVLSIVWKLLKIYFACYFIIMSFFKILISFFALLCYLEVKKLFPSCVFWGRL